MLIDGGSRFPRDDDVSTCTVPLSVDLRSLALMAPNALFGQVLLLWLHIRQSGLPQVTSAKGYLLPVRSSYLVPFLYFCFLESSGYFSFLLEHTGGSLSFFFSS